MRWITPSKVLNQGTTTAALQSEQHAQTHTAKALTHLPWPGRGGHVESSLLRGRPSVHPDCDRKPIVPGRLQGQGGFGVGTAKGCSFSASEQGRGSGE